MIKMRLSLRIPLTVAIVVVTGIIAFIKISRNTGALPMIPFIIWAVASVILIGITIWSWLGLKGLANENVLFDPPYGQRAGRSSVLDSDEGQLFIPLQNRSSSLR